ncbi:MAG: hypothetical protein OYI31_02190 [Chloroflexota bacterium]|nr:hypothetical protein [Chloroflexota bacterium]MDE2941637.1 hypothetical protein [Chloroflexota bacterium]MDE3267256.1 hypothetical protein [Chloroflexota bacterium]
MSRTGWLPVSAIAVLATIVIAVLASLGQGNETSAEAFLRKALLAQVLEYSSIHSKSSGTVTMLNGDVHRRYTEALFTYDGDVHSQEWYEGCTYSHQLGTRLCSIETVVHDNVQYRKEDTSDGPGEWQVIDEWRTSPESAGEVNDMSAIQEITVAIGEVVELERETIDGVTYRRFQTVRRPGVETLRLIESGEWDPPVNAPPELTREEYIELLREVTETELFTDEYWIRADNGMVWRVHRQWEKTYPEDRELTGAPLPQHRSAIM